MIDPNLASLLEYEAVIYNTKHISWYEELYYGSTSMKIANKNSKMLLKFHETRDQ